MSHRVDRRNFLKTVSLGAAGAAGTSALAAGALGVDADRGDIAKGGKSFVNPEKVLLWENTRKEIREWLASGRLEAAILPTGSVEQHNEHMAMVADIAIATLLAEEVALELYPRVVVAPPSPCGYAPYHMARKGTVTLRKETFQAYVLDVLGSLKAHGIRTLLVLNGHGGNHAPLQEALPEWRKALGVTLDADSYFTAHTREFLRQVLISQNPTPHAGEIETSIFMAAFPGRLRSVTMKEYDEAKLDYESGFTPEVQEFLRRDPRSQVENLRGENARDRERQEEALLAKAKTGEILITRAVRFFVERLEKMMAATAAGEAWPPAKPAED
jgi:creatinine amidohydrolase